MKRTFVLVAGTGLALWLALPLHAADIYRWVDEDGQTHLSDRVPPQYRRSAVKVDPGPTEVNPQQQKLTQERNARIRAAGDEAARRRAAEEAAADRTAPVPPAPAIQPGTPPSRQRDCAELLRRYRASQACFAPYRMANGGLRPEAFVLCGPDVPDPSGQCVQVNPD